MIQFRSIRAKLIFIISFLTLLITGFFFFVIADLHQYSLLRIKQMNKNVMEKTLELEWEKRVKAIASLLAYKLIQPAYESDLSEMNSLASLTSKQEDISFIYILDENAKVLAGVTEEAELAGILLTDEFSKKAITADYMLIQKQDDITNIAAPIELESKRVATVCIGFSNKRIKSIIANKTITSGENISQLIRTSIKRMISWSGFVTISTLGLGLVFTRELVSPIKMLLSETERISSGDLTHRLQVKSTDEVGQLALSFNNMTDQLKVSRDELVSAKDYLEKNRTELQQSYEKLHRILRETVRALSIAVEKRDPYTAGHQQRIAHLACVIAEELSFSKSRINGIEVGATIHDIGKLNVPAEILGKTSPLTETDCALLKAHPQAGYDILKSIEFEWPVAEMVLQHHERMNGSGYPHGLSNGDIIIEARILAVADVVEAIASDRPYRKALGIDKALEEITKGRGTLYDSQVVDACIRVFTEKGFCFQFGMEATSGVS